MKEVKEFMACCVAKTIVYDNVTMKIFTRSDMFVNNVYQGIEGNTLNISSHVPATWQRQWRVAIKPDDQSRQGLDLGLPSSTRKNKGRTATTFTEDAISKS